MNKPLFNDVLFRCETGLDIAVPEIWEQQIDVVAQRLVDDGVVVIDDAFSPSLISGLLDEYDGHWRHQMEPAGIGRGLEFQTNKDIRRDKIIWLEPESPYVAKYLSVMESMRVALNRMLYLGLFEYEAHFALYQPGDFYRTHRDAFRGQPARCLTTVLYLNQDWDETKGGQLGVYSDSEDFLFDVLPQAGRMVIFLSEEFPHEVKPANCERKSIAGWFRVNQGIR
ncbi:MAG: 2OG-Fe(II) oxygenase [Cellvibrio sp.]